MSIDLAGDSVGDRLGDRVGDRLGDVVRPGGLMALGLQYTADQDEFGGEVRVRDGVVFGEKREKEADTKGTHS